MKSPYWWSSLPLSAIKAASEHYKLDSKLIAAICYKESSGRQFACRYEPNFKWLYQVDAIAKALRTSESSVEGLQKTSWGLMQVMGANAWELGLSFDRFPSELCMAQVGVEYGSRYLAKLWKKYGSLHEVISAYNAGSARRDEAGKFLNQKYVDDVLMLMSTMDVK